MKMKLNPREAYIIYKALEARTVTLQGLVDARDNPHAKNIAKSLEAHETLLKRLFPAPVAIPNEEV